MCTRNTQTSYSDWIQTVEKKVWRRKFHVFRKRGAHARKWLIQRPEFWYCKIRGLISPTMAFLNYYSHPMGIPDKLFPKNRCAFYSHNSSEISYKRCLVRVWNSNKSRITCVTAISLQGVQNYFGVSPIEGLEDTAICREMGRFRGLLWGTIWHK